MAKTVIQVIERALHVFQISRFAVSSPKPNPQPSHPAMPLTTMHGKRCGDIFWGQMRRRILVSSEACGADLGWHIAPGILNQRRQIIGKRAITCILEIQDTAGRDAVPAFQAHQVVHMKIPVDKAAPKRWRLVQCISPKGSELGALVRCWRRAHAFWPKPVQERGNMACTSSSIIMGQGWMRSAKVLANGNQDIRRKGIERIRVFAGIQQIGEGRVAEVFQQQKALGAVLGQYLRCCDPAALNMAPHMMNGPSASFGGGASISMARSGPALKAGVTPKRSITGPPFKSCVCPSGVCQKLGAGGISFGFESRCVHVMGIVRLRAAWDHI